jgi:hypothetical protein
MLCYSKVENMGAIRVYATATDWIRALVRFDGLGEWQYVSTHESDLSSVFRYHQGKSIPCLGVADCESGVACKSYLIAPAVYLVNPRVIGNANKQCVVDLLDNPGCVIATPTGEHSSGAILAGSVAGLSGDLNADKIIKLFRRALHGEFEKVKAYWVGPEAKTALAAGRRLTIAIQSSGDFDLKST